MAPNLKNRPEILQTVTGLTINKAFPPLTLCQMDSSDYWEWSGDSDEELQRLAAEEEAQELASADHIVDNIVRQSLAERPAGMSTIAENDGYWDWFPVQQSYWEWPSTLNAQRELVQDYDTTHIVAGEAIESYWDW